ncbi:hypothetical protein BGX28_008830 [Mortierella sp. GBA30]|nr:hypothetical protein BGX28_008830 [Mortierella sp. GBA30]
MQHSSEDQPSRQVQQQQELNREMFLQQHNQEIQQQWMLEQQQNQQLQAQRLHQLQMQQQNLAQDSTTGHQANRKRGLATESDEFMGIKKRNLGSESSAQGMFGYPEVMPDTPGSIISLSADQDTSQSGYFDQQPYYPTSSSLDTTSKGVSYLGSSLGSGASAPTTPVGSRHVASSSVSSSSGMPSTQPSLWNQGSHSSPPTPLLTTTPAMGSSTAFSSTLSGQQPLEYQLLQEQKRLQEMQQQEQQRLRLAQQFEIQQLQRHQFAEQTKSHALAEMAAAEQQMLQHAPPPHMQATTPVHHDHNDPATWGYDHASSSGGQFVGYLGGQGRGYTPAAVGGVAALAAVSAMAASRHPQGAGRGGSSTGMDMDF